MKYRMLTNEELIPLEEDLKHFLIVNGVDGKDWENLNQNHPDKALSLVQLFSDTVLQKVYEKIRFLEFRSPESCLVFHCQSDEIELIAIQSKTDSGADLSTPESIHEALTKCPNNLSFFRSSKPYSQVRETEIHQMITQGCVPSSERFWLLLEKVV